MSKTTSTSVCTCMVVFVFLFRGGMFAWFPCCCAVVALAVGCFEVDTWLAQSPTAYVHTSWR
eukprot:m.524503 g.524503  ORF g.524503 m.524503 type:complete len:62 (-) comp160596_c0_seq1:124-309(-)